MYGVQSIKLLSGVAVDADGDGDWIYVGNWPPTYSIIFTGITSGDKAQIWVSNNSPSNPPTAYTAAVGAVQLGSDITQNSIVEASSVNSWISVRKTAHAGGGAMVVQAAALIA